MFFRRFLSVLLLLLCTGSLLAQQVHLQVTPQGDIGLRTDSPQEQVHIVGNVLLEGSLRLAPSSKAETAPALGTIYHKESTGELYVYTCYGWRKILYQVGAQDPAKDALPTTIGLQMWLDAADVDTLTLENGDVTAWLDKSGLKNDALQTNPVLRPTLVLDAQQGHAVVDFDPAKMAFLDIKTTLTVGSVFVVAKYARTTFGDYDGLFSQAENIYFTGDKTKTAFFSSGLIARFVNGEKCLTNTQIAAPINQYNLYTGIAPDAEVIKTLPNWRVARDRNTNGRNWEGPIAEIIVYDRILSDVEILAVSNYLAHKWGVTLVAP